MTASNEISSLSSFRFFSGSPLILRTLGAAFLLFGGVTSTASASPVLRFDRLTPPSALKAEADHGVTRLVWEPAPGATGYRIYYAAPKQSTFAQIAESTETNYIDRAEITSSPSELGALHRYAVSAVYPGGRESSRTRAITALRLVRPWGLAVSPSGQSYLRDSAFDQTILQKPNRPDFEMAGPRQLSFEGSPDIALDSAGRVLSVKWGNEASPLSGFCVQDRALKLVVDYRREEGSEPGQVRKPMGIAANSRGHIFIADTGNDRVQEFTPTGKFVQVIGKGELMQPMKTAFDRQDNLYVADSANNRIAVYAPQPSGEYKLVRSLTGGIKEPCCVLVDERGRVFVSTNRVAGIALLDSKGAPLWKYEGTHDAPLASPRGLAFDGKGNLLVVDAAARKIVTLKIPELPASAPTTK